MLYVSTNWMKHHGDGSEQCANDHGDACVFFNLIFHEVSFCASQRLIGVLVVLLDRNQEKLEFNFCPYTA